MANNIGYSTIYGSTGSSSTPGPIGATGNTGPTGSTGATGATGIDTNYIVEVNVDSESNPPGFVSFILKNGAFFGSIGTIKGPTGVYPGVTASSIGSKIPILRGVSSGVTLEFYNFNAAGLMNITTDTDGSLKFSVNPNTTAGGISAGVIENTLVFAESKNHMMSTYLIPEGTTAGTRIGNTGHVYINFGGTTGGRGVVADISETLLTVGPIPRGERIVTTESFYQSSSTGITLDVSYATVYKLITPIGVNAFTTTNSQQSNGEIMSVTMIVEGDDVWNFPSNVYFDEESKPVFYPGTNILHMWKHYGDTYWKAHFTARGFGVSNVTDPGLKGSCCYSDADGTKHCEDYVTANYCLERSGTFESLTPCSKNSCIVSGDTGLYDGICCSEGKCIGDIDPDLCQTIGGYFISGITCGDYGVYPETDSTTNQDGLCYNKCKPSTICCKDGQCLGNLTKVHCEEILGGKIVFADNCTDASCCDLIKVNGACCIPQEDGNFDCVIVSTPYECNSELGGVFMGNNTNCVNNICCRVPIATCYECVQDATGCNCNEKPIYSGTCQSNGYLDNCSTCIAKQCYRCNCETGGCEQIEACTTCPPEYPNEGNCTTSPCNDIVKTCYGTCQNGVCPSETITLDSECDGNCQQLAESGILTNPEYIYDSCNCTDLSAACFWCFPVIDNSTTLRPTDNTRYEWLARAQRQAQAPYRSVLLVDPTTRDSLNSGLSGFTVESKAGNASVVNVDLSSGLSYYDEVWINDPGVDEVQSWTNTDPYHVTSVIGTFRCYYLGSYDYDAANAENNKQECLKKFGYEGDTQCKLCDPIEPITYKPNYYATTEVQINNVEPYSDVIRNGAYAPFPPLWGRISYAYSISSCGFGKFYKSTSNLRLLDDTAIIDLCVTTKNGNLKYYMYDVIQEYIASPIITSGSTNTNIQSKMGSAIAGMFGIPGLNSGVVATSPEIENCLNDGYLQYDPYLKGPGAIFPTYYGANMQSSNMKNCVDCYINNVGGWYLPAFSATISGDFVNPVYVSNPTNDVFDVFYPGHNVIHTSNGVGEVYYVRVGNNPFIPRGIFGRNLRYNLGIFASSTLFYNRTTDGSVNYTMNESDSISIPINFIDGYTVNGTPDECIPSTLGGQCPGLGCQTPNPTGNCQPQLGNNTGQNGDSGEYWTLTGGLIVRSLRSTSSPFTFKTSGPSQSRAVKIAEGICVDMVCPECYSYESC